MVREKAWIGRAVETLLLICGSALIALSFNLLLNPNEVASGGVSGISVLLRNIFGWEPALVQWAFNIPLFVVGALVMGRGFAVKTAAGSVLLPLLVLMTRNMPPLTDNVLLAAIFGGIGVGAGLGIVFRGRGSTGGIDVAAQLLHRLTGLSYGLAVASFDAIIIAAAGIIFSPEKALYALVGLFVTMKTIDVVQVGFRYAKVALIISAEEKALGRAILHELDRGLTKWTAQGGYTGEQRELLMVVVSQTEVSRLKQLVKRVDPGAFVILSDTAEVLGEGFKNSRNTY
ncbi:YitT family protein [Paenibacillus sp. y28]|uniref:YitT family protein n=1 Tax=Paenibacillus sp. y28 TaxID=3129110 RepID=UPI0030174EAE